MRIVKLRHKILFGLGLALCSLFFAGESDAGQRLLQGHPKPNETHWEADDRVMGAGLAPLVYCLAPGVAVLGYALIDLGICAIQAFRATRGAAVSKAR
jgi:hypothetical protein